MRFTVLIEQDVPRLNVAMKNPMFMRIMNSTGYLGDQFYGAPNRHRLTLDHFVKLAAFDELHAEVGLAIALADLVNGNNAWMFEASSSFRLSAKALQMRFARPLTEANDL